MREYIDKFKAAADEILTPDQKQALRISDCNGEQAELTEWVVSSYNSQYKGEPLVPIQGKDSDGELIFLFEDREDAVRMYEFFVESRILEPGEIMFRDIEGQYSVAFMPHVIIQKPDVIQAAMLAYEDRLSLEDMVDEDVFEDLVGEITALLEEPRNTTSGAPKRQPGEGNPFHDKDGRFAGVEKTVKQSGGSWAMGKRKLKFTGKGKNKSGGLDAKYGSTSHPCGRAAREQGKNTRCWDGQKLGKKESLAYPGFALAEALRRKMDGHRETIFDVSTKIELRRRYGID